MKLNGKTDVSVEVFNGDILKAAATLVRNMADLREDEFISDGQIQYWSKDRRDNALYTRRPVKDGDEEARDIAIYLNNLSQKLWQERYNREHNK